jgi:phosphate transport system protein
MSATLDQSLVSLKESLIKMMQLVSNQLIDSQKCITELDSDLAEQIKQVEKIVNRFDSTIEKQCESIIALYNPVATDLRFVLASIRIGSNLERIGDISFTISNYVKKDIINTSFNKELLSLLRFNELYEIAENQIELSIEGFTNEDTEVARKVLKNDLLATEINKNTTHLLQKHITSDKKSNVLNGLYLFSIMNQLERVSGLCTNIAEETIYYLEAEILKHQKIKLKKKEMKNFLSDASNREHTSDGE